MQSPLAIGGHAHIAAYLPATPVDAGTEPVEPAPFVAMTDGARDTDYWSALASRGAGGTVVLVWEGDQHMNALLGAPVPPLDFVLSHAPDLPLDPRASYVPESQMRALFAPSLAPLGDVVARLGAEGATVVVVGTPPPPGDDALLRRALAAINPEVASASVIQPVTSAFALQKSWSLLQIMVGEAVAATGARFVPVPDRVRDEGGFLHPWYAADDGLHANARFGETMLAEVRAALDAKGA